MTLLEWVLSALLVLQFVVTIDLLTKNQDLRAEIVAMKIERYRDSLSLKGNSR